MSLAHLIPNFRQVDGVFVGSPGAAVPLFECAEEHDAEMAVMSLNELLERADEIEADSIRAIAALTADRDRLADENTELREALEEIIAWKDRANDDRQEVNEMVVVAERALRIGKAGE